MQDMSIDLLNIWQRIQSFQLDEPGAAFPFSRRLAAENGWQHPFALALMEEYKRFLFLTLVSPTPVTPSREVDAVWHLHLIYTYSYWECLCGETLGRKIHHHPTRGGSAEGLKFYNYYCQTLTFYESCFGEKPPAEFWPQPEQRFGKQRRKGLTAGFFQHLMSKAPLAAFLRNQVLRKIRL